MSTDRTQRSRLTRAQAEAQREIQQQISEHMNKLRAYADGLEQWYVAVVLNNGDPNSHGEHPRHVINGMRKIANEVSQPTVEGAK